MIIKIEHCTVKATHRRTFNTMESLIKGFCGALVSLWTNHRTCWTCRSCANFGSLQISSVCVETYEL